ncbi:zinc-dependent peptidase [Aeoliella sp. ICT_H6.2]|uniref:Zinc-dependent peptidase n=1 Tax=Aeoliella straminimaris TaxID=2954799 RepID=A0A9X2FFX7_9BACT|nr:zinc-dependent peptidase [Aeoliella straminimaris]MCO6048114.1 zinc-dependent peptidase [Aeoliella straminimaris]
MFRSISKWLGLEDRSANVQRTTPRPWREYLHQHIWQYQHLKGSQRERLEDVVRHVVAERYWSGGSGFEVTDEMRVTVAGMAALMTLGLDEPYYFPRVPEIVLYPHPFFATAKQTRMWGTDPIFGTHDESPRLGEAWRRGPIVLAWDSIVRPRDEQGWRVNVVIHEFTHHLDGLDGDMSGTPPMTDLQLERDWYRVTELDYLQLVGQAERGESTLLSHYGATNRAEFFAVASECFFDQPHELRDQHARLYEVLARFFRQSPADFLPHQAQPPLRQRARRGHRAPRLVLQPAIAHDPFSRGTAEYQAGDLEAAVRSFTKAIASDPDDAEAYSSRALANYGQERFTEALADALQALELDADDSEALLVQGCVLVRRGEYQAGLSSLKRVCEAGAVAEAYAHWGYALMKQGDFNGAIRKLSDAKSMEPHDPEIYRWRAEAYRLAGKANLAEEDEERANHLSFGNR